MRMLDGILIVLSLVVARPQDSLDLRARYGEPTVERFEVLPNVTLTAEYDRDGHPHVLEFEPRHAFLNFAPMPFMSEKQARDALAEVMPETRGKNCQMGAGLQAGQGVIRFGLCGNLAISEVSTAGSVGRLSSMQVHANSGTLSPTSKQLHARYGKPDVEVFPVSQELMLTTEYGEGGQPCAMRIEVAHKLGFEPLSLPEAPLDQLAAIFDEVVPPEARGRKLGRGEPEPTSWHEAAPRAEYENVRILPYYGTPDRELKVRGIDVMFQRATCSSPPKQSEK